MEMTHCRSLSDLQQPVQSQPTCSRKSEQVTSEKAPHVVPEHGASHDDGGGGGRSGDGGGDGGGGSLRWSSGRQQLPQSQRLF